MKKKAILGLATAICTTGLLAGCGEPAKRGDSLNETVETYMGHDLHCVVKNESLNAMVMSCDFVRYHNENGASNG